MTAPIPILVNAEWLNKHLNDENVVLLDTTIPVPGADNSKEAEKTIIPGALRFDIDSDFSDQNSPYPHTCLSEEIFTQKVKALGTNTDSSVIVYDDIGIFSSPRVWWMFKAMGHAQVAILDGGLPAWLAAGFATNDHHRNVSPLGNFRANLQPDWLVNIVDIEQNLTEKNAVVIDARSADRFYSRVDEPRPGLRRGNIPGSINLPFAQVLQNGHYKTVDALAKEFAALHLDKQQALYFSCGSGVTACIDAVAAKLCGFETVSVYDGSWAEWGSCKA